MSGGGMRLPESVQEIADVIGRSRALYLIGRLPKTYPPSTRTKHGATERVILYVPKSLRPDHALVSILGWHDAMKLVRVFGGEILQPANCREVYRRFRDQSIRAFLSAGSSPSHIAALMGVSDRHVKNLSREIAQEDRIPANDNIRPNNGIGYGCDQQNSDDD